jgi:hypothetical protein
MSKVFIWDGGWGGAAQVVASCAVILTLQHEKKTLLIYTDDSYQHEQGFIKQIDEIPKTFISEEGIIALHRLSMAGRLTPASVENYTIPLIQRNFKLDLASGNSYISKQQINWSWKEIAAMIQNADQIYDKVIIHLSGNLHKALERVEQERGQLIVVLRQDRVMLDNFFKDIASNNLVSNIPLSIVLCNYDPRSKWNLTNIKRKYKGNIPILGVPYCTKFMDAWNEGDIISFLKKQRFLFQKNKQKQSFIYQFDALAELITENAKSELLKMRIGKGA